MKCEIYHSLDDIPASIREMCSYPRQVDFFSSLDWFANLYRHSLAPALSPLIFVLSRSAEQPKAVFFCGTKNNGRTVESMTNFYTISYQPLIGDNRIELRDAVRELLKAIRQEMPGVRKVQLRGLLSSGVEPLRNTHLLRGTGFYANTYHQHKNWYQVVKGECFDNYYARLSSRLRNTIRRKEKKLARAADYAINVYENPAPELDNAIEAYVRIYNSSWKDPEPFPDFTPGLIRTAAQLGILRLGILTINDNPAAAQLWINTPKSALIYKLAYTDEYASHSPGSILSREMFRVAIDEDGVGEIDYGVGDDRYKRDWMTSVRDLVGIEGYNLTDPGGLALATADIAAIPLRWVRSRMRGKDS